MLVQHVRAVRGDEGVAELLARAGETRPEAVLLDDASWSSYGEMRRLLEASVEVLGSLEALADVARTAALEAGSMPGVTEALQALGSPDALLTSLNEGNGAMSRIETNAFTEHVGPAKWDLGRGLDAGFEPYPELCIFQMASVAMIPRLFGYSDVHVEELECQCDGDVVCRIRLTWTADDEHRQRADFLASRLAVVERRAEMFEETVASLVSAEELEPLLARIVEAASTTVHAPSFVLALDPLPWTTRLVYAVGMSEADARTVAEVDADEPQNIVVPVVSNRRAYGRLIAVGGRRVINDSQIRSLEAYARLAATALDGAVAVEQATREAGTAQLLLDLAMRIARLRSLPELAETLAEVVPEIVGCDRAVVTRLLEDGETVKAIAASGYAPEDGALILDTPFAVGSYSRDVEYFDGDTLRSMSRGVTDVTGAVAIVVVPIIVDDEVVAWISADVLEDPSRLKPSEELETRLRGLAALASTAMHNALLLDRVSHQAHHDALTGLPNRKMLVDRLNQLAVDAEVDVSVLFVDIDDFKDVNDGLGHHAGDALLAAVGQRLVGAVRDGDLVARLGGDEFAIAVVDREPAAARAVANRVIESLEAPFAIAGEKVTIGASVGVAAGTGFTVEEILRNADVAMYSAKAAGKGRFALYEPGAEDPFAGMNERATR